MLKYSEAGARELVAELTAKLEKRWKETVDQTRFMDELREGKLKKETIQLYYKNWGAFVPVINSIYTSAFYKQLWFFVKNVDLMEVYTEKVLDEFGHPCPPGHIQILIGTGKALGLTAEEDVAGSAGLARFSADVNGRRPDSGILVLGLMGTCIWRNLFGLVPRAHYSLWSDHGAGELFL
jgi:hypothetical protein